MHLKARAPGCTRYVTPQVSEYSLPTPSSKCRTALLLVTMHPSASTPSLRAHSQPFRTAGMFLVQHPLPTADDSSNPAPWGMALVEAPLGTAPVSRGLPRASLLRMLLGDAWQPLRKRHHSASVSAQSCSVSLQSRVLCHQQRRQQHLRRGPTCQN